MIPAFAARRPDEDGLADIEELSQGARVTPPLASQNAVRGVQRSVTVRIVRATTCSDQAPHLHAQDCGEPCNRFAPGDITPPEFARKPTTTTTNPKLAVTTAPPGWGAETCGLSRDHRACYR